MWLQAYPVHAKIVSNVGQLEALMVPADYPKKLEANIPADFAGLPRLLGRSTVNKDPGTCTPPQLCDDRTADRVSRQAYVVSRPMNKLPSLASRRETGLCGFVFDDLGCPLSFPLALLVSGKGGNR